MADENIIVRLALEARDYVSGAAKASKATRDLNREAAAVEKKGNKAAKAMDGMAKKFVALFAAKKAAAFLKDSVRAFSDLVESANAVEVQFGKAASVITDFGAIAAESVGLAQSEFQQLSIATGALLSNFTKSSQGMARETVTLTQRAADVASVFNVDVTVALQAFQSAIQGQSRPIRQFGVLMDDFSVRQKAVELGLAATTAEVGQQDKAAARLALIYEQTEKTAGDFAATSGELANQQRIVSKQFEDAKAVLGEALAPAMADFLTLAGDQLIPILIDLVPLFSAVVKAIGALLDIIEPGLALMGRFARDLGAIVDSLLAGEKSALLFNSAMNHVITVQRKGGDGAVAFANAINQLADAHILDKEALDALAAATQFEGDQRANAIRLALEESRARGDVAGQTAILEDALLSELEAMDLSDTARRELIDAFDLHDAAIRANADARAAAQAESKGAVSDLLAEKDAMRAAQEEAGTAASRFRRAAAANKRLAASAKTAEENFSLEADAIRDVAKAQAEAANPLLRLLRAQGGVRDAQQAIVDVQEDSEATAQDLVDANVDLLEAQLDLEGATADAADKLGDGEAALFDLAEQAGVSEEFVRELILALDDLPTQVGIDINMRFNEEGERIRGSGFIPPDDPNRAGDRSGANQFGGSFAAFEPIRVGEGGPETLVPTLPGRIETGPAGNTGAGGGGETNITLVMEGTGDGFEDVQLGLAMIGITESIEFGGDSTLRG
jgi:hypothetical protein